MNGEGELIFENGLIIKGIFKNGGLVGDVEMTMSNGDVYKGDFK